MPNTDGTWTQSGASNDLQIFIGADEIRNTSGTATLTLNASGDLSMNVAASQSVVFVASVLEFLRTGMLATAASAQQQFGTAASQPGPSAVAGTSDPLALKGIPPIPSNQMATLGNFSTGAPAKGFQINSIDVIYQVIGVALTTHVVGITKTIYVNNTANAVTNVIAKAANGLATAVQANPYVTNIANAAPTMITSGDTELLIELDVTTPSGSTYRLYGFVMKCSYNLN